jgi:hypothetical protein
MSITYQIFEAAHQHGLDHMPITNAAGNALDALIGEETGAVDSWGQGAPTPGKLESTTITYSGGYTQHASMVFTGPSTVTLRSLSLADSASGDTLIGLNGSLTMSYDGLVGFSDMRAFFSGADTIIGNSYGNMLKGYGGDDFIDGKGGLDHVFYDGQRAKYSIGKLDSGLKVSGLEGVDTLAGIERLHFADASVAFDVDGAAGQAYRLYQAAFDRTPDSVGLGFWINALDSNMKLEAVAAGFLASNEAMAHYGPSLGNAAFAARLYEHALHRAPDTAGLGWWVDLLDRGAVSRTDMLVAFSESAENKAALATLVGQGIAYTEFHW